MDPESERTVVLEQLEHAVQRLEEPMDRRLIPAGGAKVVYAIRGARDKDNIAGIRGGIVDMGGVARAAGPCAFGADESGAKIVLTAMKFDPSMRSCAIIRFSPAVRKSLEQMFLEICSFDRSREPPGIATMDWGVASCCRDGVPDVVFDRGAPGREGIVRLFGEKPDDVVNNIIILSNRIMNVEL
jgi:predicted fused transcriptional regulator/phosphomethylpyrimidine kinase